MKEVWYAAYGSNLLKERFLCYICGGKPEGSEKKYKGSEDKTLPKSDEPIIINRELYFSKHSSAWNNGGVAFIRSSFNPDVKTLGRIYRITEKQLIDVAKQETNTSDEIEINFAEVVEKGNTVFKSPSWYGNCLFLGSHQGIPIFTISSETNFILYTTPALPYLKTISNGIKETYDISNTEIAEYLVTKSGITGIYSVEQLLEIIN